MAWLLRNGDVLASVTVTTSAIDRLRATSTLENADCVLWCEGSRIAHSIGASCPLDVAYLDLSRVVLAVNALRPWRIGRPRVGASVILEGRAGSLTHWNLRPGDCLEIRE
ncbi:MAG TPA: hypothetical protein VG368_04060 [Acidimicrobiales bacterium]|jgi:hypothetical protein|nr:hypothetical protein [Acidimicrobiales bacterium]